MITEDKKTEMENEIASLKRELAAYKVAAGKVGDHMTEIARLNLELSQSKRENDLILQTSSDAMILVDKDFNIVWSNHAMEQLCCCEEGFLKGKQCFRIVKSDICNSENCHLLRVLKEKRRIRHELSVDIKGKKRNCIITASPLKDETGNIIGILEDFLDITDLKKMEEEIVKFQKLDSLSLLAGGIAHDFNNYLTAIIGNISLALMMEQNDQVVEILKEAERSSILAKNLTQQLLTFSRGGNPIKEPSSIKDLLEGTVKFSLRGSNVDFELDIPPGIWNLEVDRGQINQVINNLIINAKQAMPNGGRIKVLTENLILEGEHGLPLKDGKYVRIQIKDPGLGIPEKHLSRIFDPYFTTKQEGSGLGLSVSYSILKKHDGYISIDSALGNGTTVSVYLPASPGVSVLKHENHGTYSNNGGKILVMDDNPGVRKVLGKMLNMMGFDVQFAKDGKSAVEIYKNEMKAGNPFDIVICDLTIPGGMGGGETIKRLVDIDPKVKAIASSGYPDDPIMSDYRKFGFCNIIPKPYRMKEMSVVLKKVLNRNGN